MPMMLLIYDHKSSKKHHLPNNAGDGQQDYRSSSVALFKIFIDLKLIQFVVIKFTNVNSHGLKVRISSRAITNNGAVREKIINSGIDLIAISLTSGIVRPLPPPPIFYTGGLSSSNLAIKVGIKDFFQKGRGQKERILCSNIKFL